MNHRLLLVLLSLPAIALAQTSEPAKPNPDLEKAVIKVAHDMAAALTKPDVDAATKMLADSYYAVAPDGGTVNKAQFLADLKSGKFKLEANELDDMKVHFITTDLAVITYRSTDKGNIEGHDISGQYRWLDVLTKHGGTWQFAVSQGTPLGMSKK
jgi:ketosteroid isomerase-like protein